LVRGCFSFYLGTDPAKLDAVKAALHEEIAKLAASGLTAEEVARAKEKIIGQQEIRNQSNHAFATHAALHELYGLGCNHYREQRRKIEALTVAEVQRTAAKYFLQPGVLAIVAPE
jgi:predicted Zn-dependent peptidase